MNTSKKYTSLQVSDLLSMPFFGSLAPTSDVSIITLPLIRSQPIRDDTIQCIQSDSRVTMTQK